MNSISQTLLISTPLLISYLWLQTEELEQYSLQAFVASILVYIFLKKINESQIIKSLSNSALDEVIFVGFSFHLLIGGTGGLNSSFFFLNYIYIFFLALFCNKVTSIILTIELILFYILLNNGQLTSMAISSLLSLPLNLLIAFFAKKQYDLAQK